MSYVIIFGCVSVSPIILLYHFLMLSFWVWGEPFQLQGKASMSQLIIFYFRVVLLADINITILLWLWIAPDPPTWTPVPYSHTLWGPLLLLPTDGWKSPTNRLWICGRRELKEEGLNNTGPAQLKSMPCLGRKQTWPRNPTSVLYSLSPSPP